MKQHEAQPLVLDTSTQVGGISPQSCGLGTGMVEWWWGELGWLSFSQNLPCGQGGRGAAGEQLTSGF